MADEDLPLTERDATTGASDGAAALRIGIAAIGPQNAPGFHVHREDVVRTVRDIECIAVNENLGLSGIARIGSRSHTGAPQRLQASDVVAIEEVERRVALIE